MTAVVPVVAAASMSPEFLKNAAYASQLLFLCVGLVFLWIHVISPAARARRLPPKLPPWNASLVDVLVFFFHGIAGGFIGSLVVALVAKPLGLTDDAFRVASTAALHCGVVAGVGLYLFTQVEAAPLTVRGGSSLLSGFVTFFVALPPVTLTNVAWLATLKGLGVDPERQPAIEMVARLQMSPWFLVFIVSAIVIAPIAEELLFRGGLFRLLRTRQKRWIVLALPSLLFAAIHVHLPSYLPLAVLGVVFALAYERTGNIGTPIVAHGLFNLNNLLVLLATGGK